MKNKVSKNNLAISKTVLFALYACNKNDNSKVSRIAIQKLLYLATVFAPIKDIILDFIRFQFQLRGPYSKEVQNAIDSLVSTGHAVIVDYTEKSKKVTYTNYKISEAGIELVNELTITENEKENLWWISSICKLAIIYSKEQYDTKRSGLDKIVDLVYQEPTFLKAKKRKKSDAEYKSGFRKLPINFNLKKETANELIIFAKKYLQRNNLVVDKNNEKWIAELILFNFFEFLHNKILLASK